MAAAHKRCSLVFVHKIDGILKIQCRIKMKKGRWNVPFHYELRFTDSGKNYRQDIKNTYSDYWNCKSNYIEFFVNIS